MGALPSFFSFSWFWRLVWWAAEEAEAALYIAFHAMPSPPAWLARLDLHALGAEGECTALRMPMNSTKTSNISCLRQEIKETIRIAGANNSEIRTYR